MINASIKSSWPSLIAGTIWVHARAPGLNQACDSSSMPTLGASRIVVSRSYEAGGKTKYVRVAQGHSSVNRIHECCKQWPIIVQPIGRHSV